MRCARRKLLDHNAAKECKEDHMVQEALLSRRGNHGEHKEDQEGKLGDSPKASTDGLPYGVVVPESRRVHE